MRTNKSNHQTAGQSSAKSVHFEFVYANAKAISIVGTFNGWRSEAAPMTHIGEGRWFKELVLPPGVYEYQFLVDGQWMPDPQAAKTAPNLFGEVSSVLHVSIRNTPRTK